MKTASQEETCYTASAQFPERCRSSRVCHFAIAPEKNVLRFHQLFCFVFFLTRFGSINSIGRPMFEERESRSLRAPSVEHTKEFRPPSPAGCDMDLPFHFLHTAFCSLAGRRVKRRRSWDIHYGLTLHCISARARHLLLQFRNLI